MNEYARHDFLVVGNLDSLPFIGPRGTAEVPMRIALRQSGGSVSHAVAAGIGPVPALLFDDPMFKSRLVPILPHYPLQNANLYAVYVSRRYVTLKIRSARQLFSRAAAQGAVRGSAAQRHARAAPESLR